MGNGCGSKEQQPADPVQRDTEQALNVRPSIMVFGEHIGHAHLNQPVVLAAEKNNPRNQAVQTDGHPPQLEILPIPISYDPPSSEVTAEDTAWVSSAVAAIKKGAMKDLVMLLAPFQSHTLSRMVNLRGQDGLGCLHHAVTCKQEQMCKVICSIRGVDADLYSQGLGITPLTLALDGLKERDPAGRIFHSICQILLSTLEALVTPNERRAVDNKDQSGEPLVVRAVRLDNLPALKLLVSESARLDATDAQGTTALHVAAIDREPVKAAVPAAPPVRKPGAPVAAAVPVPAVPAAGARPPNQFDNLSFLTTLLQGGANPNVANLVGSTPLRNAITWTSAAGVQLLLEYNAEPQFMHPAYFLPPLLYVAVNANSHDKARLLLEYGADTDDGAAWQGAVPLVLAVERMQDDLARLLLQYHADPNVARREPDGDSVIMMATKRPNVQLVKSLIVYAADVNVADAAGFTPLHHATLSGHKEIVQVLLEAGADPNRENKAGLTPYIIASDETIRGQYRAMFTEVLGTLNSRALAAPKITIAALEKARARPGRGHKNAVKGVVYTSRE